MIERAQHGRVGDDVGQRGQADRHQPHQHHRAERQSDGVGAETLDCEQDDDDDDDEGERG